MIHLNRHSFTPRNLWERFRKNSFATLLPPSCVNCKTPNTSFCDSCIALVPVVAEPICQLCGGQTDGKYRRCYPCFETSPLVSTIRAAVWYEGPLEKAIRSLKYDNKFSISDRLAEIMLAHWSSWERPVDLVIPIPLHPDREIEREYNQAELLAKRFADGLGLPMRGDLLGRTTYTKPQAEIKSRQARRENIKGAFGGINDSAEIAQKNILLIDDVCTTGATLSAAAHPLLQAGAHTVTAYCLARARGKKYIQKPIGLTRQPL